MTFAKLALSSALTALAVGAAPVAVAANVDQGPIVAGPTAPGPATQGGPVAIFPRDQTIGGANPDLPDGTDPLSPFSTWIP